MISVPYRLSFPVPPPVPQVPSFTDVAFRSRDDPVPDVTLYKFVSVCAKVLLFVLDPGRRPSLPSRRKVISFLEDFDSVCTSEIQNSKQTLIYCDRL